MGARSGDHGHNLAELVATGRNVLSAAVRVVEGQAAVEVGRSLGERIRLVSVAASAAHHRCCSSDEAGDEVAQTMSDEAASRLGRALHTYQKMSGSGAVMLGLACVRIGWGYNLLVRMC